MSRFLLVLAPASEPPGARQPVGLPDDCPLAARAQLGRRWRTIPAARRL